jgi:hypothetical protein
MKYVWTNGEDEKLFRVISCICGSNIDDWSGSTLEVALEIYRHQNNPSGTIGALKQRVNYARCKNQLASYYRKRGMHYAFHQVMCGLLSANIVKYPDISARLNG